MEVPYIEQKKIQAVILVPFLKALYEKYGKEDIKKILGDVVDKLSYQEGVDFFNENTGTTIDKIIKQGECFASSFDGPAIDVEPVSMSDTDIILNITRCAYADYFKSIGETELGELLACRPDFPRTDGYNAGVTLERPDTIMCGAEKCGFHYRLQK